MNRVVLTRRELLLSALVGISGTLAEGSGMAQMPAELREKTAVAQ